jgi:hypothetical protein
MVTELYLEILNFLEIMLFEILKFKEITIEREIVFWVKTGELLASSQSTIGGNVSNY